MFNNIFVPFYFISIQNLSLRSSTKLPSIRRRNFVKAREKWNSLGISSRGYDKQQQGTFVTFGNFYNKWLILLISNSRITVCSRGPSRRVAESWNVAWRLSDRSCTRSAASFHIPPANDDSECSCSCRIAYTSRKDTVLAPYYEDSTSSSGVYLRTDVTKKIARVNRSYTIVSAVVSSPPHTYRIS